MTEAPPIGAAGAAPAGREPSRLVTAALCLAMFPWIAAFAPQPEVVGTLGLVAALALIERCRRLRHAFGYLMLFGAVGIGYGYRWLAPTVRVFGDLDQRLGVLAAPASWLVLAVYGIVGTVHGLLFAVLHRASIRPERPGHVGRRPHPLLTVALFVSCETLPIRFLPWMSGYGAVDVAPLRQAAEWGGVPAVSFALLCLVVPIHEGLVWALAKGGPPARPKAALATFLVGLSIFAVGWVRYRSVLEADRTAPASVRVGIVQANVGSKAKSDATAGSGAEARSNRDAYERGSRAAAARGAELIVWPESALVEGLRLWDAPRGALLPPSQVSAGLRGTGYRFVEDVGRDRAMLLGAYEDEDTGRDEAGRVTTVRYNAALLREPGGASWSLYRKTRLIPFGESMPMADTFPSLRDLLPQRFRMVAGSPSQPPLAWKAKGISICAFVCYEAILPDVVRELSGSARPDLLVNLTNDSWYGDTWEPRQHLNFARFRAVEHRAPLVRATNTGISAFVDASGDVLERSGYDVEAVLVRDLPLVVRGRTPYEVLGAYEKWLLWFLALAGLVWTRVRRA